MKTLFAFTIMLLITVTFVSTAQTPTKPACLQLVDSTAFGLINRDSVYIDTCQNSPTYNLIFAYLGFLRFKVKATHIPYYPDSTTVDTNWTIVDTAYPQIRSVLQTVDTTFGHFTLRKTDPADTSDLFFSQRYLVTFDSYAPCTKVDSIISAIPDSLMFWGWFREFIRLNPVIESDTDQQNNTMIVFNGDKNEITVSSETLKSGQVTLYDIRGTIVAQTRIENGKAQLGISTLSSGTYFIKCGSYTKKVFIGGN